MISVAQELRRKDDADDPTDKTMSDSNGLFRKVSAEDRAPGTEEGEVGFVMSGALPF